MNKFDWIEILIVGLLVALIIVSVPLITVSRQHQKLVSDCATFAEVYGYETRMSREGCMMRVEDNFWVHIVP